MVLNPELSARIQERIRDVPDFPKPGIIFKDLTPVWGHGPTHRAINDALVEHYRDMNIDTFVGIESRGFINAAPVASALNKGLTLLRKPGKLPYKTVSQTYDLEYGQDSLHMHADAVCAGTRAVVIDDLLATGGTMRAAIDLLRGQGAEVVEVACIVELAFLEGRARLDGVTTTTLVTF